MKKALLVVLFAATASAQTNLIVNGGFEQNGGQDKNTFTGWTVFDQAGGSGSWVAQLGTALPGNYVCKEQHIVAPPSGFAAMSTQSDAGSHVLYQDVAIPGGVSAVTLSVDLYINSDIGFSTPPTLDYKTKPNQQFRIDIMDPTADVQDVGGGVLANLYATKSTDSPVTQAYATQTYDLTRFAGRTIRLRFAAVDNQDCFHVGLDNVSITTGGACPSTAPGAVEVSYRGAFSNCGASSAPCEAGERVAFTPATSGYAFQTCDSFAWDFGDGTTSASMAPAHVFVPGVYTVRFTVTNTLGTQTADAVTVRVTAARRHRAAGH